MSENPMARSATDPGLPPPVKKQKSIVPRPPLSPVKSKVPAASVVKTQILARTASGASSPEPHVPLPLPKTQSFSDLLHSPSAVDHLHVQVPVPDESPVYSASSSSFLMGRPIPEEQEEQEKKDHQGRFHFQQPRPPEDHRSDRKEMENPLEPLQRSIQHLDQKFQQMHFQHVYLLGVIQQMQMDRHQGRMDQEKLYMEKLPEAQAVFLASQVEGHQGPSQNPYVFCRDYLQRLQATEPRSDPVPAVAASEKGCSLS